MTSKRYIKASWFQPSITEKNEYPAADMARYSALDDINVYCIKATDGTLTKKPKVTLNQASELILGGIALTLAAVFY